MKKTLLWAALTVLLPLGLQADEGMHKGEMKEKRLEHLTKKLDLTAEQQASLSTILDEQHAKMKALHEETQSRIDSILTPEQKAKRAQMKDEMKEKKKEKRK